MSTASLSLQIPTVTVHDLFLFHSHHFSSSNPISATPEPSLTARDIDDYDEDGLGYYPDGAKRTLTDVQISMFRHSEIHTLLRERKRREEAEGSEHGEVEVEVEVDVDDLQVQDGGAGTIVSSGKKPYKVVKKQKKKNNKNRGKGKKGTKPEQQKEMTHRRIAREQDDAAQAQEDIDLDYG